MAAIDRNWREFLGCVTWFLDPGERASVHALHPVGSWQPAGAQFDVLFRPLGDLLRAAEITEVVVRDARHLLFTWNATDNPRSWLCRNPSATPSSALHPDHVLLLQSFGGIVERANEPDGTWLLNQNEVLTEKEASHDTSFIEQYAWAFADCPGGIPINLRDYYSISREANGNDTLCSRRDGTVLLFAPDHAFTHVTSLAGCPPRTLYTLSGAARFADWVNLIARQWATGRNGGLTSDGARGTAPIP